MILYNPMMMWMLMVTIVTLLIWFLSIMFISTDMSINNNEPFECGLEPISNNRLPFCMHFFLVGILFLVFDIELIISIPVIGSSMNLLQWLAFWLFFMLVLFVGLLMEIMMGTLDWKE